jgi:hypothetical protein
LQTLGNICAVLSIVFSVGCGSQAQVRESPRQSGSSEEKKDPANKKPATDTNDNVSSIDADNDSENDSDQNEEIKDPAKPITNGGTGGTGGKLGTFEQTFSASNGKSSTWKTTIPDDMSETKPYGLSVYLHGDGGGDYTWVFDSLVKTSKKHNLIGMVVKAPNFERRWYNGGIANAKFLDELIEKELLAKYNIDKSRIYFIGTSGGSQFLGGQFIPNYGSKYNSGALLLCGGPKNWQNNIVSTPEFISKFKFYWYSGTSDFLYDQIQDGIEYYKGLGMQVDSEMIPGGSHCNFPGNVGSAIERKLQLIVK